MIRRIKKEDKEKKKNKLKKEGRKKKENTKKNKKRRKNVFIHCSLFLPAIFLFILSLLILLYCKYRCVRESGREVGPPDQVVVPAFVVPAGVPKRVTTPRLLCMHYYFSSMITLVQETAQRYFPSSQLTSSTETVDFGVF